MFLNSPVIYNNTHCAQRAYMPRERRNKNDDIVYNKYRKI